MKARENPFRAELVDSLAYRAPTFCWERLLDNLRRSNFRGAIVGDHGRGKSTLLRELAARLTAAGERVHLLELHQEDRPRASQLVEQWCADIEPDRVVLLDGAEQLSWWPWRQLLRSMRTQRGLVITTHKPGRLPTLWHCETTPELFYELTRELAGQLDRELAEPAVPLRSQLREIFLRSRGDVRQCLRKLYLSMP